MALSAPLDALYAACEVNEAAWEAASAECGSAPAQDHELIIAKLRHEIDEESNPALLPLADAAVRRRVAFVSDDDHVSVGLGSGALAWPVSRVPDPTTVDWSQVHDIPLALVTGTNGKTTTVRMLGAMAYAADITAGNTSTDGVQLDSDFIAHGDYTGGEGARLLLRDRRVNLAVLEIARGGMLRRGLPVTRADVALVTNVGTDHLGEYGVVDLRQLAAVKLIVARAVRQHGLLIVNADDPVLAPAAREVTGRLAWLAVDWSDARLAELSGDVWLCRDSGLGLWRDGTWDVWLSVEEVPATLGGAAIHNVYNALGALGVGAKLGLPREAICLGLSRFASDSRSNPGRGNVYALGGVIAYADFAHNPEGLRTVLRLADSLPARRRLVILGDRTDEEIDALAEIAAEARPDRIILKQMREYLRGREPGVVVRRLRDRLDACGFPGDRIEIVSSEMGAVRRALEWAEPNDLLFLLLHAERDAVLDFLDDLASRGWEPGSPLPGDP